jgi:hypothetical protein
MIISQIIGGLGNQMFQYAVGRALSLERRQPLLLDTSGYVKYSQHHGFELHRVFNCVPEIATISETKNILGWCGIFGIKRILSRPLMKPIRNSAFVVEPHFHYWPGLNQVPIDCYLAGYWQSEKYFRKHLETIRSDFVFKNSLKNKNLELAIQIDKVNSVSLHIRRGDYVSNKKTNAKHGVCNLDYYHAAVNYMSDRVEYPTFFIFSDDIEWARENLKLDFPHHYIDHNIGVDSYIDMHLMSLCQHHIIANSSFSWWGAWLNPRSEKIVAAPKGWFKDRKCVQDLIPHNWVQL